MGSFADATCWATIDNGDDRPLQIIRARAYSIDRWLVCDRDALAVPGREIAVYAGNELLPAPQYDLAKTIGSIDPDGTPPAVRLSEREANPFYIGPTSPKLPWSEEHKAVLWTLTIVGVVVLGGLTAVLLWKAAQSAAEQERTAE